MFIKSNLSGLHSNNSCLPPCPRFLRSNGQDTGWSPSPLLRFNLTQSGTSGNKKSWRHAAPYCEFAKPFVTLIKCPESFCIVMSKNTFVQRLYSRLFVLDCWKKKPQLCCLTKCCVKMSCFTVMISMLSYLHFTQSQLLLPKAHNLLLVAIAFSSTILLNPNPHIDLLCTLVINYPQVKRLKTSWTKAGQGHFTESHLINIFIFLWLDPRSFYAVSACVWAFLHTSSKPCTLRGPYCCGSSYLSACWWLVLCNHILQRQ